MKPTIQKVLLSLVAAVLVCASGMGATVNPPSLPTKTPTAINPATDLGLVWDTTASALKTIPFDSVNRGGSYYFVSDLSGVCGGTNDDAKTIDDWLNSTVPAGATIIFPNAKTCLLSYPLQHFNARQRYDLNGATLKFQPYRTTTTATVAYGATSAAVADRTGFKCGQRVIIAKSDRTIATTGFALTINGITGAGNCATATGAGSLYFSAGVPGHDIGSSDGKGTTTNTLPSASVVTNAGMLFDSNGNTAATDVEIFGGTIDGSRSATLSASVPRWEADVAVHMADADRMNIHDLYIHDTDSEGIVAAGNDSRVEQIAGYNIGGNLVHWGTGNGQITRNITAINGNLGGVPNGHSDGMVSFSNGCNYAIIGGLYAQNFKRVFGGADGYGGSVFTATGLVGYQLTTGPFQLTYSSPPITGTTTSGSTTVTAPDTQGLTIGNTISGTGIASGTTIAGYTSSTITLSQNATASGTVTLTVEAPVHDVQIANGVFDNAGTTIGLIDVKGGPGTGDQVYNLSLTNISGTNINASFYQGSHIRTRNFRLNNAGNTTDISFSFQDVKHSDFDVDISGGNVGINAAGPLIEGTYVSGYVRNQGGSNAKAIAFNGTPDTVQVHAHHLNIIEEAPAGTAWVASTSYTAGNIRYANGNNYLCRTSGTSTTGSGPSGTGLAITDGSAVWDFLNHVPAYPADGNVNAVYMTGGGELADSELWITSGLRSVYVSPATATSTIEFRRNKFRRASGFLAGTTYPIQFATAIPYRLVMEDNDFTAQDLLTANWWLYSAVGLTDATILRNNWTYGGSSNAMRIDGNTTRVVMKDNVLPYKSGADASWSTPGTWATQTVATGDPIYFNGTPSNNLIYGNVMRAAAVP